MKQKELVIDEENYRDWLEPVVDGERKGTGCVPRDYARHPVGYLECCREIPQLKLIPRSEWSERIREMEANRSRLSDIRLAGNAGAPIPSLDQDGKGYCWAHSTTTAVMLLRAVMGQPYVPLSAYAVACMEKNFRDEGGWGAESLEFITRRGVPSSLYWPMQSMDRANDNPATWQNAALHRVTEGWVDLSVEVYDRKLNFDQIATLLLSRVPVVGDYWWWGHSVCLLDLVEPEPGSFGVRILNSWGDRWSDRGMGVLKGRQAIPDSAVAPRITLASLV